MFLHFTEIKIKISNYKNPKKSTPLTWENTFYFAQVALCKDGKCGFPIMF